MTSTLSSPSSPSASPTATSRRERTPRGRSSRAPVWSAPAAFLACIAIWWLASAVLQDDVLLPTPGETFGQFIELVTTPVLWNNALASLTRVFTGWAIAVVIGIATGMIMALWAPVRWFFDPIIEFTRPIPPLAYSPLLAVWFGIGELPKVLIIILTCYPVIVIATRSAILDVDQDWVRAAQTLGASKWQAVYRVTLPGALPQVLTAVRISSGLAWGTLVAAELIAADSGLGYMILQASTFLQTGTVLVGIVIIGLLAFGTDVALRALERWIVPWRGHTRAA